MRIVTTVEFKHGGREELHELFNFEREINSAAKSYIEGEWEKVEVTADSGASGIVEPPEIAESIPVRETMASRAVCYVTANGSKVANLGEKRVSE